MMDELESIVRALAAADPVNGETVGEESYYECVFCTGSYADDHEPECPWRRAREWVDAHPEPRPQTFSDMAPGWRL